MSRLSGLPMGTDTHDYGSLADGGEFVREITVPGAKLGDFCFVSFDADIKDLVLTARVTTPNTVSWQVVNSTGGAIDLGLGTCRVKVIPWENM